MSEYIEVYVRRRGTPNADVRTGTIATAPARIRIMIDGRIVDERVIATADPETPIIIAIDEIDTDAAGADQEPPTRLLAAVAARSLSATELEARNRRGIPPDAPITRDEAEARVAAGSVPTPRPKKKARKAVR